MLPHAARYPRSMNSNLIAVQRTDKNGINRRVWVRPDVPSGSAASLPAPTTAKRPVKQRTADTKSITAAFVPKHIPHDSFKMLLARATDEELRMVANALDERSDDYTFHAMMAETAATTGGMEPLTSLAILYSPELYPNMDRFLRRKYLHEAEGQAEKYYRASIYDMDDEEEDAQEAWENRSRWNLMDEDESTRVKVKNFAYAWCTVSAGTGQYPSSSVMYRVMDDSKGDTEAVLAALRRKPTASVAEIDFMVKGGMPVLNDGAL